VVEIKPLGSGFWCPQNLTYSLHEAGVVTTGGIDFIPLAEHPSILGTPVGKCRL